MTGERGEARVVLVSAPNEPVAESLVRRLVEERAAACGTIVPGAVSIYRWEGGVEHEREVLIVLKATASGAARLVERIPELHPYDVPEVLVLPVESGHGAYLDWLVESTDGT